MLNSALEKLIHAALAEDLGEAGDITSNALIGPNVQTTAILRARKPGVAAGIDIARETFRIVDPALKITIHAKNGDTIKKNAKLLTVRGSARSILAAERVALNFASHLSGIATLTARYVAEIKGTKARILDTRKTTPGLRALEKAAVAHGGGVNHRMGLYDAILIKDNHIRVAGGIRPALDKVAAARGKTIEIEVDTLEQLAEVLKRGGADIVLLDNMDVKTLKKAVEMARDVPKSRRPLLEASGGVTLETVRAIAKTGVDYISVGALTHSAPILDLGLDIDL